ncbi:hypothetical protein RHMOL_Rhmol11G0155700 [Rhododendron molle]|uniref:Uncharacterized protein n=1 Tax=Rhododendron molle TaxID=49168 RepID=A0ACC0LTJ2_RHOML|nr:hypothetical protein RHMOL_Rhmol11G0155700 [Rhododendron molle]
METWSGAAGAAPNLKTRVLVANYFTSRGKRRPSWPCPACQFFNEAGEGGGEVLRLIDKEKDDEEETAEEFREREKCIERLRAGCPGLYEPYPQVILPRCIFN